MVISRRTALAVGLAAPFIRVARAADEPLRLGALCPLTGAGGQYGPSMVKVIQAAADAINQAGGIGGRQIAVTVADTQTNPDAGVAGAHKLIDVDRVSAVAMVGTWANAVDDRRRAAVLEKPGDAVHRLRRGLDHQACHIRATSALTTPICR